jgi:YVTN family beta-propeller protein
MVVNSCRPAGWGARGYVVPVNTTTFRKGRPVPAGLVPGTLLVTPNGRTLYAADWLIGQVTPIDTATNTAGKNIKVGVTPGPIVIAPDGKTLYVLCAGNVVAGAPQEVVPVNTATNTAGRPINTGLQPTGIAITGPAGAWSRRL